MKTSILILFAIMVSSIANAQFLGGFFSQKKENRKRLMEQIAALQVYKGYLQKGYTIASTGLNTINKIKNGDFGLHKDFFTALKRVNPKVKKYSKVADLISLNVTVIQYAGQIKSLRSSDAFCGEQRQYIDRVLGRILEGVTKKIDELIAIISDNQLELKDDERINRIDNLYAQMEDQYSFIRSFAGDVGVIKTNYSRELNQINQGRILNELTK
jgi:hypothetical protein